MKEGCSYWTKRRLIIRNEQEGSCRLQFWSAVVCGCVCALPQSHVTKQGHMRRCTQKDMNQNSPKTLRSKLLSLDLFFELINYIFFTKKKNKQFLQILLNCQNTLGVKYLYQNSQKKNWGHDLFFLQTESRLWCVCGSGKSQKSHVPLVSVLVSFP